MLLGAPEGAWRGGGAKRLAGWQNVLRTPSSVLPGILGVVVYLLTGAPLPFSGPKVEVWFSGSGQPIREIFYSLFLIFF